MGEIAKILFFIDVKGNLVTEDNNISLNNILIPFQRGMTHSLTPLNWGDMNFWGLMVVFCGLVMSTLLKVKSDIIKDKLALFGWP